jgi:4-carboxymuconolactone decarboxylase
MTTSTDVPSADDAFTTGRELAARLFAGAPRARPLPREMMRHTMGHLFGDVWQGDELTLEQRSLITCAVLTALGRESELRLHTRGARNLGIERDTLEAMMIHVAHYAGWPTGASGLRTLGDVWDEMDGEDR